MAGDELLPTATAWTTHAITIAAPPAAVWPWLAQMGWGRGGWYIYRWVDRLLFPANGPSANQLLPEHQQLRVGDRVPDAGAEGSRMLLTMVLDPVIVLPCLAWATPVKVLGGRTMVAALLGLGAWWTTGGGAGQTWDAMEVSSFSVGLADGRSLEVSVSGPDQATPLVIHHGTPSDRTQYRPFAEAAAVRGLRLVSYSRPGYGGSSRQPGRTIADCAADSLAIVEQLGAGRFYTAGWSGGGPHALACAVLLPDRVLACATIAGVGPFGVSGLEFLAGMGQENHEEFGAALAGPSKLQGYLERQAQGFAGLTGEQVAAALGDLVSPVDVGALTGDFAAYLARTFRQAVSRGIWGWFDDDLAFTRPWGFDLDEIGVPVAVWQGGQDRMVPFAHGQWLATHVPGARPRLLTEEGHLSIAVASFGRILDDLLEDHPPVGE